MLKRIVILFLFLLQLPAFAAYIAVLETMADKNLLTMQERLYLTDVLRGVAVQTLPAEQNFTIMTRENINVMLPPGKTIEDCEGSCLAETGKNIAADYVAQARVGKVGEYLFISTEIYETAGSKLIASFQGRGSRVEDLEQVINVRGPDFFGKVIANVALQQKLIPGSLRIEPKFANGNEDLSKLQILVDSLSAQMGTMSLEPGAHELQLNHPCYDPVKLTVNIEPKKETVYDALLVRGEGPVSVSATRDGNVVSEVVYVNGDSAGLTPFNGTVPLCASIAVGLTKKLVPAKPEWNKPVQYEMDLTNEKPADDMIIFAWQPNFKSDTVAKEQAQKPDNSFILKRHLGGHIAATFNDWWGDNAKSDGMSGIGFNAGVGMLFPVMNRMALNPEVDFSLRRQSGVVEYNSYNIDVTTTLMYVDVPVLVRYQIIPMLYVDLGPMVSFNIKANEAVDVLDQSESANMSEYFNRFETDLVFGLGSTIYPKGKALDIDFRFILGLTNVPKESEVGQKMDCKNMQFSLGVNYWFL